jgi:DNA-binding NarL/FixJ family response regulator
VRIVVVDHHSLFRDGIVSLLEGGGHQVVGQGSNGIEAIKLADQLKPDLLLMDVQMPVMNGLSALKQIKSDHPQIKVVMLTMSEDEKDIIDSIRTGADGYLLKQINSSEFFQLLERLPQNEPAISSSIAMRLYKHIGQPGTSTKPDLLSDRELEVLRLVADGRPNRDIAEVLSVSDNTVKYHIKNIIQKLQASNRAEAVKIATQLRLIE